MRLGQLRDDATPKSSARMSSYSMLSAGKSADVPDESSKDYITTSIQRREVPGALQISASLNTFPSPGKLDGLNKTIYLICFIAGD